MLSVQFPPGRVRMRLFHYFFYVKIPLIHPPSPKSKHKNRKVNIMPPNTTTSDLDALTGEIQTLKVKVDRILEWIRERFGTTLISSSIEPHPPIHPLKHPNFNPCSFEHSYCISTTENGEQKTFPQEEIPPPNLYDLAQDDEDLLGSHHDQNHAAFSPPSPSTDNHHDSLQTPKKSSSSNFLPLSERRETTPPKNEPKKISPSKSTSPKGKSKSQSASSPSSSTCSPSKRQRPHPAIQCEVCGKLINGKSAMKRHSQTHTNVRPHQCTTCGKSFQRKFHLKTHQLIHTGEKKHQCRFCGKMFSLPKDIIAHERVHTGEKPFACTECPRRFNLKSHLVMHLRTHSGEKPYKCDQCDKAFSQANSLRVHKKTHNNVNKAAEVIKEEEEGAVHAGPLFQQEEAPANTSSFTNFNVVGQLIPISLSPLPEMTSGGGQGGAAATGETTTSGFRIPLQLTLPFYIEPDGSETSTLPEVQSQNDHHQE